MMLPLGLAQPGEKEFILMLFHRGDGVGIGGRFGAKSLNILKKRG
jgi:hypothetical protein